MWMLFLWQLVFCKYDAVKITAYEIAKDYACVYRKDLNDMYFPECKRNAEIEECICYAVREAAYNEKWHT